MAQDDERDGARYPCCYGPSTAYLCFAVLFVLTLPVGYAIAMDSLELLGSALVWAVSGGGAVFVVIAGRSEAYRRRIVCAADRIMFLARSLPRRTDAETLAVVGEIRARYAEALALTEGVGRYGRPLAGRLRNSLERIDREYDARGGSLRCADASAASLAMDVRGFSEEVDVREVR